MHSDTWTQIDAWLCFRRSRSQAVNKEKCVSQGRVTKQCRNERASIHTQKWWITHWMDWSQPCCSSTRVCTPETERPTTSTGQREIRYFFHFSFSKMPTSHSFSQFDPRWWTEIFFFSFPHREVESSSIWVYNDCRYYHRHTNTKKRKSRAWRKRQKHMQQLGSKKDKASKAISALTMTTWWSGVIRLVFNYYQHCTASISNNTSFVNLFIIYFI